MARGDAEPRATEARGVSGGLPLDRPSSVSVNRVDYQQEISDL